MPYYVYIIKSEKDGTYYKGSCENYIERFEEHNAGLSGYTSYKIPWKLIYAEKHPETRSALIRERKLKRQKANTILSCFNQSNFFCINSIYLLK